MVQSSPPTWGTTLKESSDEDGAASGTGGTYGSLAPPGCNVVTATDPIITTPDSENTPALQTILTVIVRMTVPQPGMELLPDQQQAYKEGQ
jgi:hypothetical protein